MILLVHLLFGALIGQKISNPFLAIILAFLSHYLLDLIPHVEYSIENIKEEKKWRKVLPELLKIFLDFCLGLLIIFLFSKNQPITYVCALFAIVPDGLTVLSQLFPYKILKIHNAFHFEKIHWFRDKKISNFWRIVSQVIVVALLLILFKF